MIALLLVFTVAELTVGIMTNSLALLADAFHMLSDQIALLVGFVTLRVLFTWQSC